MSNSNNTLVIGASSQARMAGFCKDAFNAAGYDMRAQENGLPNASVLLRSAGFAERAVSNSETNSDLDISIISTRPENILAELQTGVASQCATMDCGVIGADIFLENAEACPAVCIIATIPTSAPCSFCLFGKAQNGFSLEESLTGKIIATPYPNVLREILKDTELLGKVIINACAGATEDQVARRVGGAAFGFDLVQSGQTLRDYKLAVLATLVEDVGPVVVANMVNLRRAPDKMGRIQSVIRQLFPESQAAQATELRPLELVV
jgi:ATP phosphoribosyltransferase